MSAGLRRCPALTRRRLVGALGATSTLGAAGTLLLRAEPAAAVSSVSLAAQIRLWAGNAPLREGRVELDIAPLVENGNAVPITVRMASPMTPADHVEEITVYNERNPQREVVRFAFGPAAAKAEASARIRLATSQQLVALARLSDGSQWASYVNVIVTLAACVEG